MGDRVAVMKYGVLQQVDTPDNLHNSPANAFVASFIGSPAMNLFEGRLTGIEMDSNCTLADSGCVYRMISYRVVPD